MNASVEKKKRIGKIMYFLSFNGALCKIHQLMRCLSCTSIPSLPLTCVVSNWCMFLLN